jgi:hypothetical protein
MADAAMAPGIRFMTSHLDLKAFCSQLRTTDWRSELLGGFKERQGCGLESGDCALLVSNARMEIERGKSRMASNWINLGLFLDADRTLNEIRRTGLLRASTRRYRDEPIATIVYCFIEQNADGLVPEHAIDYLRSVSSLLSICPNVHRIYSDIVRTLRAKGQVAPKTLVAIVELMFMQYRLPDLAAGPDAIEYYPIEQRAEALSYLLHLFVDSGKVERVMIGAPAEAADATTTYCVKISLCQMSEKRADRRNKRQWPITESVRTDCAKRNRIARRMPQAAGLY